MKKSIHILLLFQPLLQSVGARTRLNCQGEQHELRVCEDVDVCEEEGPKTCVDCEFGDWLPWSECTCNGLRHRERHIHTHANDCGTPCEGVKAETEVCVSDCQADAQDCALSEWAPWDPCPDEVVDPSTQCGAEHKMETPQTYRTRFVIRDANNGGKVCEGFLRETKSCPNPCAGEIQPVDCELEAWRSWSDCSLSCGGGQH